MEMKRSKRKGKACGVSTKSKKGERRRERMRRKLDQEGRRMKEEEKLRKRDKNEMPVTTANNGGNVLKVKILGNRTSPQSLASIVRTSKVWIAGGAFETRCYIRDNKSMGCWMSNMVMGHVKCG